MVESCETLLDSDEKAWGDDRWVGGVRGDEGLWHLWAEAWVICDKNQVGALGHSALLPKALGSELQAGGSAPGSHMRSIGRLDHRRVVATAPWGKRHPPWARKPATAA